ncbi:MAG: TonB-dependent receptor [Bacteroidales bacterium]|nr:TonB-dependent receptor [Bacteroidales bacterium]
MRKLKFILIIPSLLIPLILSGQHSIEGKIFDSADSDEMGLPGASVIWAGTTTGTSTNAAGYFKLKRVRQTDKLVISFIGYKSDTVTVKEDDTYISHGLTMFNETGEVVVVGKAPGAFISRMNPVLTTKITSAELRKAACCNLSESFETNASVDVNYADAATGAKQIQLLGLAGSYTQILAENIPAVYGLATAYGLNYIPGPWMESIQISKGTSSVRNGYESVAGQINVEYKKPAESEKVYFNGFISDAGRQELNAHVSAIINERLSTMIMAHGENQMSRNDHNNDGFRDEPDIRQYHFFNRWDYLTPSGDIRFGIKFLEEERTGGQYTYDSRSDNTWSDGFGINIRTKRAEAFLKTGKIFGSENSMSVGWINNASYHNQDSWFGLRQYAGTQRSYYSNLLYQWTPGLGKSTIDAGLSYKYDNYDERLDDDPFGKTESVPGAFVQYTYADTARITLVAGLRTDYHNLYGTLVTPRVHLRYALSPALTLRASAGKGYRSGNVLAENSFMLASSRRMVIAPDLEIEEAWNAGISLAGNFSIGNKDLRLSADFFNTNFLNQIVTDLDATTDEVRFYNLDGKSYSNVFQVEASFKPLEGLDLLAAWRWNDVMMTIDERLLSKPLTSRHRGLFTASYLTRLRKWQYDYTLQVNGPGRVPSTAANPEEYRRPDSFGTYPVMNFQVTRYLKRWQFYAGAENLLNYKQHDPIIAANDPFGEYFDASLIWGPVHGRKIYGGFRFMINREL